MANTLNLGDGKWARKEGSLLAYNSENNNYKPLPFTFDRASSATRVNKDGLIETVGADQPRVDYLNDSNGALKLEPSRTNLITYSEDFSNAIWTNTGAAISVNPTADLSPDGTLTGNEFNEGTSSGRRAIFEDLSVTANEINTLSVFVKKGTSNHLRLVIGENGDGTDWTAVQVDLSNNSLSTNDGSGNSFTDISSSISSFDYNGYYRLQLSAKHPTATSLRLLFCTSNGNAIAPSNSYGRPDYTGTNKTVFVWGCQLESNSSYATSIIKTQGSAVTRLADVCNNSGNDQVINSTEGVLYAEISALANDLTERRITISDGTTSNRVAIEYTLSSNQIKGRVVSSSTTSANMNFTASSIVDFSKIAISYKQNEFNLWINGTKVATDTSGSVPIGLNELAFDNGAGNDKFNGNVKDVRVYNTALTDQELAALTQV